MNSHYTRGGLPITEVSLLRLISELEGSYQLLKYMGFNDDESLMLDLKTRYYKKYFALKKRNSNND
jgi:hypothetical protein